MAFQQSRSSLMQTAFNAAASIVAAEISVGLSVQAEDRIIEIKDVIFNELIEEFETEDEAPTPSYNGRSNRELDPATFVLKFGAHSGESLEEVYGSGEKGRSYVRWLSLKSNNETAKSAASRYLAKVGAVE